MSGRVLMSLMLGFAAIFGAALWYFQSYAYYYPLTLAEPEQPHVLASQPVAAVSDDGTVAPKAPVADAGLATPPVPPALGDPGPESDPGVDKVAAVQPGAQVDGADGTGSAGAVTGATLTPSLGDPVVAPKSVPELPADSGQGAKPKVALIAPMPDVEAVPTHGTLRLRLTRVMDGLPEEVFASDFEGIDADTSPLKFRACFTLEGSIPLFTETYRIYDTPEPLKAPRWFHCFDAGKLTEDLETGTAIAFLAESNFRFGVDRVIAVYDDGRSFAWNQFNDCGIALYAGDPLPSHCPPQPER